MATSQSKQGAVVDASNQTRYVCCCLFYFQFGPLRIHVFIVSVTDSYIPNTELQCMRDSRQVIIYRIVAVRAPITNNTISHLNIFSPECCYCCCCNDLAVSETVCIHSPVQYVPKWSKSAFGHLYYYSLLLIGKSATADESSLLRCAWP